MTSGPNESRPAAASAPRRLLPAPLLSLVLFVAWPVLNGSFSVGHLVLGALLAIVIPWFTEPLRDERARLRHAGTIARLGLVVLWDIVVSNIDVARRILGPESNIRPGYLWLPLSITDPHGIVALAGIITMTPGTLSADLTEDRRHLLVHCFHLDDEAAVIATIKSRYEAPLLEIFE
jgi:multicomponent K+:H+ antiporter subunit E